MFSPHGHNSNACVVVKTWYVSWSSIPKWESSLWANGFDDHPKYGLSTQVLIRRHGDIWYHYHDVSYPFCRFLLLEVLDEEPSERGGRKQLPQIGGREGNEGKEGSKGSKEGSKEDKDTKDSKDSKEKMSFEAFRELLVEHKVELSKFGTGAVRLRAKWWLCFQQRVPQARST